jgi:hypothetical protein
MTSLLSSLSGEFTKSLLLGTFLPVVVFVVLGLAIGLPLLPPNLMLLEEFKALDKEWLTIAASFLAVLIAGLLYNLNIPIIRLYEGYPWKSSLFGQFCCSRKSQERKRLRTLRFRLQVLRNAWKSFFGDTRKAQIDKIEASLTDVSLLLAERYSANFEVLPTRLGNTLSSAELYSLQQYGLDAIPLWPRMVAVIPKDYSAGIDDAKSAMDFFLNASVLSGLLAIFLIAAGLWYQRPFASRDSFTWWIGELLVFCLAAWQCYRYSDSRAAAWGSMIRASFDLYRYELLKQLGIKQLPVNLSAERAVWTAISQQESFGDMPADIPELYSEARFWIAADPPDLVLATSSGMQAGAGAASAELSLFCKVENTSGVEATKVKLRVYPPDGYEFKWGSASVTDGSNAPLPLEPSSSTFDIGSILPSRYLIFACSAIPVPQKNLAGKRSVSNGKEEPERKQKVSEERTIGI